MHMEERIVSKEENEKEQSSNDKEIVSKLYKVKIKYFYDTEVKYIKETTHVVANTLEEAIIKIHNKYDFKGTCSFQFRPAFIIKIKEM